MFFLFNKIVVVTKHQQELKTQKETKKFAKKIKK